MFDSFLQRGEVVALDAVHRLQELAVFAKQLVLDASKAMRRSFAGFLENPEGSAGFNVGGDLLHGSFLLCSITIPAAGCGSQ